MERELRDAFFLIARSYASEEEKKREICGLQQVSAESAMEQTKLETS